MKIKITADSTCDLSVEIIQKNNVDIIPLYIALGEDNLLDGVTIVPDDIYNYYQANKKLPKSGARSVVDYEDFFKGFFEQGYEQVIHFSLSDDMSSSHANAKQAAQNVGNVHVVDTRSLSTGMGLLILYACDLVKEGLDAQTIVDKVTARVPYVQASFILDNLEFLHKGGRCSSLVLLGANLLGIKPVIEVKSGKMGVGKKFIGRFERSVKKYVDHVFQTYNTPHKTRCFVTHTKMDVELVNKTIEAVKALGIFEEVLETTAGSTITTHCGANTIGVLFINDGDKQ